MPEAITKYAINSTLGTSDFKPLDQIIIGQKVFVASNEPIARAYTENDKKYYYFIPSINGVARVKFKAINDNGMYATKISIQVRDDNGIVAESEYISIGKESSKIDYLDFPVISGTKYRITYDYDGPPKPHLGDCYFCANIIDANYFKTEVIE